MGIGSSKGVAAAFVGLLAVSVFGSAAAQGLERTTGIWKVLREGGFDGPMNEDAHIWPIGNMDVGAYHYRFMHYEWLESKQNMVPGGFPHGHSDLLVFDRTKKGLVYLGVYRTAGGRPRIKGHTLVFPYKDYEILGWKRSKTITFDEKGPPAEINLDGENFGFAK
jgi:hypothetical protein